MKTHIFKRPTFSTTSKAKGFTLLEMLIVLIILLVLASITMPMLQSAILARQLEKSVENVRDQLTKTRLRAIDSGRIYAFYYEPEGTNYLVIPYEPDELESLSSSNQTAAASGTVYGAQHAGALAEGQRFLQQLDEGRSEVARLPKEWLSSLENGFELAQKNFASPILFYPDGSATEAQLEIVDDKKQKIRLNLRELTGAVTVSNIEGESLN